jgi:hypothetical protein
MYCFQGLSYAFVPVCVSYYVSGYGFHNFHSLREFVCAIGRGVVYPEMVWTGGTLTPRCGHTYTHTTVRVISDPNRSVILAVVTLGCGLGGLCRFCLLIESV